LGCALRSFVCVVVLRHLILTWHCLALNLRPSCPFLRNHCSCANIPGLRKVSVSAFLFYLVFVVLEIKFRASHVLSKCKWLSYILCFRNHPFQRLFPVPGIEPSASSILDKCSNTWITHQCFPPPKKNQEILLLSKRLCHNLFHSQILIVHPAAIMRL
jgi:hypothetical protein